MEIFIPEKFIEARKRLQEKGAQASRAVYEPDADMEDLIRRLYQTDESLVKAAAISMTDKQADMLAGYVPYNFYGYEEGRLFDCLKYRMNAQTSKVLYGQWQESFQNPECNEFLKSLAQSDRSFREMLEGYGISPQSFVKVLESENIPLGFDEELIGRHFADGSDFDDKLKERGVQESSMLDIECKRALLTFCGTTDYLSCSQENLLGIIRGYDKYMLRKFLFNFLRKMSLSQLQAYPELAAYLRNMIGHRKSETFQAFFEGADAQTVQHYVDWINIFKLNIYFENDERSRFWKQYRFQNVIRYPASNTLVLEFENHVAIEFLGGEPGTIYLCEKESFRKNFYDQLNVMGNDDIRIYFRLHKDLCLEYRNHTARWQAHVGNVISKRQITDKVTI